MSLEIMELGGIGVTDMMEHAEEARFATDDHTGDE